MSHKYDFDMIDRRSELTFRVDLPGGMYAEVETPRDDSMGPPWKEHDGHGEVTEWTSRNKRPGEWILCSDRGSRRYYDFAGAIKLAKKDGWGVSEKKKAELAARLKREPTRGQIVEAAVISDFDHLRAWCNDDWQWISVHVTLFTADGTEIADNWLGGVESEGDYWKDIACERLDELLHDYDHEEAEKQHWAERDVATV